MSTTQVEPKKEKRIDRNHWMSRIQKFCFNIDSPSFYRGYCPFFWMTWIACICAPVVALFKILSVPFDWLYGFTITPVFEYRTETRQNLLKIPLRPTFLQFIRIDKNTSPGDPVTQYDLLWDKHARNSIDAKRIALWFKQNPDWRETDLPAAKIEYDRWMKAHNEAENAKRARVRKFRKVSNAASLCGSVVFKGLIPAAILTGAYFIITLLIKLIGVMTLANTLGFISIAMFVLAGLTLIYLIVNFFKIWQEIRASRRTQDTDAEPGWVLTAVISIIAAILNACCFIKETVQMTYKAECPMIIWGEETGSIEKRSI